VITERGRPARRWEVNPALAAADGGSDA